MCLVALAFFWLNLWREEESERLREAFLHHPWRLPKRVTYLFDWLATQIGFFLHPKPIILPNGYFDTGSTPAAQDFSRILAFSGQPMDLDPAAGNGYLPALGRCGKQPLV